MRAEPVTGNDSPKITGISGAMMGRSYVTVTVTGEPRPPELSLDVYVRGSAQRRHRQHYLGGDLALVTADGATASSLAGGIGHDDKKH